MSVPVYEVAPSRREPGDTAVFFVLPFGGDIENTGDRLLAAAEISGATYYVTDLAGQVSPTIIDLAARRALKPGANFKDTCKRQAEAISKLPQLDAYPVRIASGHSLGGVILSGMQRYGEVEKRWSAVELVDCFNIRAPERRLAYARFLGYQAVDAAQKALAKHFSSDDLEELPHYDHSSYKTVPNKVNGLARLRNIGPLMRSNEGVENILGISRDASVSLHVVGLTKGLSGPESYMDPFLDELRHLRHQAVAVPGSVKQPLKGQLLEGWHSRLLDPNFVASILQTTRELVAKPSET